MVTVKSWPAHSTDGAYRWWCWFRPRRRHTLASVRLTRASLTTASSPHRRPTADAIPPAVEAAAGAWDLVVAVLVVAFVVVDVGVVDVVVVDWLWLWK